jgi:hypothetical protein
MMQKQTQNHHGSDNEDDAMFTRKPLGGTSCASCEKDVINMYGKKADYLPWNRLPFRDPSERIARIGQGFSKMLSMINPDTISRFESTRQSAPLAQHMGSVTAKASIEENNPLDEEGDTVKMYESMPARSGIRSKEQAIRPNKKWPNGVF